MNPGEKISCLPMRISPNRVVRVHVSAYSVHV